MNILPNPTPLERALEDNQRILSLDPEVIRKLYRAAEASVDRLPSLAFEFSMDFWDNEWPEQLKRDLLEKCLINHMRKGTPNAIHNALKSFNCSVDLIEWWQRSPKGKPFTFSVAINLANYRDAISPIPTAKTQAFIMNVIEVTKPASRIFDLMLKAPTKTMPAFLLVGRLYSRHRASILIGKSTGARSTLFAVSRARAYTKLSGRIQL